MENKKNILIWVLAIFLAINIAAITTILIRSFDGCPPRPDRPFPDPVRYLHKELNLSKKQADYFNKFQAEYRDEMKGYFEEMRLKRTEILNKLASEHPDTAELSSLTEEYGKLHVRIKKATVEHFLKMKEQCNPQQEERLNEFIKKIRGMDILEDMPHRFQQRNGRGHEHKKSDC